MFLFNHESFIEPLEFCESDRRKREKQVLAHEMRPSGLAIHAVVALFASYVVNCAGTENAVETPIDKFINGSEAESPTGGVLKTGVSKAKNISKNNGPVDLWMARMGNIQNDLINVQAIIVKDEDAKGACDPAERKSNKRYLMCAGSILNRNHILSSASCIHEATHIRHNIRSPLAVVIAPLKPSIQVIRVTEYKIHPGHHTNPYSRHHLAHNVAILKLACRIEMENYFKVELPTAPFVQTCSEDNCVVAIFRKTGMTSNVMFQVLAPNIPFPSRRRKETTAEDIELRRYYEKSKIIDDFFERPRQKRKLAEPPVFTSRYEMRKKSNIISSNSTTQSSVEVEASTVSVGSENSTKAASTSLADDLYKSWISPTVANKTIRSLVVRSSNGYRSCAQTGAAVMSNRTQAAVVSVPCDDRQKSSKWLYTDIWDNLDWIHDILQDWTTNTSVARPSGSSPSGDTRPGAGPGSPGNYSGCSTCIFNFFIEIGCKDKNRCGNKSNAVHETANSLSGIPFNQHQGCSGGNSIGIEVGIGGQGCDKRDSKSGNRAEYRGLPVKPIDVQIGGSGKQKHLPNGAVDVIPAKLEQPVTVAPVRTTVKDRKGDKDAKYTRKDNSLRAVDRSSSLQQTFKTPLTKNVHRDRATNEIGLQNIEGDSTDWLSEVEKGLDLSSEVKRELVESRRSS